MSDKELIYLKLFGMKFRAILINRWIKEEDNNEYLHSYIKLTEDFDVPEEHRIIKLFELIPQKYWEETNVEVDAYIIEDGDSGYTIKIV